MNSESSTIGAKVKVLHGSTDFADSQATLTPSSTTTFYHQYAWWTVWTAVSSEGIKAQIGSDTSGTTTGIDQFSLIAIKLSDDLVEDTDWKVNEVTAATALTTSDSSSNNASITFTPGTASHHWLVLSKSRCTAASTTRSMGTRIVSSGTINETGPFQQFEPSSTTDKWVMVNSRVFTLGAVSNTFDEKSFSVTANANNRQTSGIFALDLSKMKNVVDSYSDSAVTDLSGTNFGTEVATISITPTVAGDSWIYGYITVDQNATGINHRARIQIDNTTDIPADATSDVHANMRSHDATDEGSWNAQGMNSLTTSAHTIDLDASVSTSTSGRGARAKSLFAVTMELSINALAKAPTADTIGISEGVSRLESKTRAPTTDTIGISETPTRLTSKRRVPTSDVIGISEQVSASLVKSRVSASDTVGISETVSRLSGKTRISNTDTIGISESINWLEGKVRISPTDVIGISESVSRLSSNVRIAPTETVGVSEAINWLEGKVRIAPSDVIGISESVVQKLQQNIIIKSVTDVIGISESVNISRQLTRQVNEQISIADTVNRLENLVRQVSEQEGITEDTPHVKAITQIISDTVDITETVFKVLGLVRIPDPDIVGISETVVQVLQQITALNKETTDTVGISEAVSAVLEVAPQGALVFPPSYKRRIAPRARQRLIEPFKEITREELEKEKEKEEEQEIRTPVTSKLRFVYNIQSSTVYQEVKEIKDALARIPLSRIQESGNLTPQYSRQEIQYEHEPQTYDRPEEKPLQEQAPTTPPIIIQTGTDRDIKKYKFSSSLKFNYAIKDGILYNKLLKYARLLDTIDIVDKLEEQEEQEEEQEIVIQV